MLSTIALAIFALSLVDEPALLEHLPAIDNSKIFSIRSHAHSKIGSLLPLPSEPENSTVSSIQ